MIITKGRLQKLFQQILILTGSFLKLPESKIKGAYLESTCWADSIC
jgi:hypothetical protein